MTFSYDLDASGAPLTRARLRLAIGDTAEGSGPRPNGANYADEELSAFLFLENGNLSRAQARALETLAGEWARYAGSYRLGPESGESLTAVRYAEQAAQLRRLAGYTMPDEVGEAEAESGVVDWSAGFEEALGYGELFG